MRTQFDFRSLGPPPNLLPPEDDRQFRTWSINLDVKAPFNECCGVQGELFAGANLSPFLGGIGQGVCPCLRVPIRGSGGWGEFWYYLTPQMHFHTGYGLDDPNNADSLLGRSYNSFLFANVMYDFTKKFTMGFEVTYWRTTVSRRTRGPDPAEPIGADAEGNSWVFDWMCKYAF